MKQEQKSLVWTSSQAILFAIGLLGSTPTFAANSATGSASVALPAPTFLGGLALAQEGTTTQPTRLGSVYSAYDAEAIGRYLEPSATETTGIDPMQTAAIIPGVFGSVAIPMRNFPVSARWASIYRAISGCIGNGCGQKNNLRGGRQNRT